MKINPSIHPSIHPSRFNLPFFMISSDLLSKDVILELALLHLL